MARKSRKENNHGTSFVPKSPAAGVAAYVRLSTEDIFHKGDSIETQKLMINNYMALDPMLELYDTYVDIVSGTTFERPEFIRMMADIENGRVNCVIVKDLSRLGRNVIDTGYYVEKMFPTMGVRMISINDNFDSATSTDYTFVALKNMLNEAYALDIATKTKSQARTAMEQGIYVGGQPPYGYIRALNDKRQLCVDAEAAKVVRRIFHCAKNGATTNEIARKLNTEKILPPSLYKNKKRLENDSASGSGIWYARTIQHILANPIYIGKLVQGKTKAEFFIRKASHPDEWICVENSHEAIIETSLFEEVQVLRQKAPKIVPLRQPSPYTPNLFKGKIFCGHCGHPLERKKNGETYLFRCVTNRTAPALCPGNCISEDKVKAALIEQLLLYHDELVKKLKIKQNEKEVLAELHWLEMELTHTSKITKGLYENYVKGILTVQEYKELRDGYQGKIDSHNQRMSELMRLLDGKQQATWTKESIRILDELDASECLELAHMERFVNRIMVFEMSTVIFKMNIEL